MKTARLLAALLVATTLPVAAQAQLLDTRGVAQVRAGMPAQCRTPLAVQSDIRRPPTRVTRHLSSQIMSAFSADMPPSRTGTRSPDGHHLRGLAYWLLGFDVAVVINEIRQGETACVYIPEAKISAGHTPPIIWIHPDLRAGTCEYRVTMDHERQHIANYHAHLDRFRSGVTRDLASTFAGGLFMAGAPQDIPFMRERVKARLMEAVSDIHDASRRIADRQDAAMDTPANYRRLSRICR